MSLEIKVKCPLCKTQIPSDALRCSHCAEDLDKEDLQENMKKQATVKKIISTIIIIFFIIFIAWACSGSPKSNTVSDNNTLTQQNTTSESTAYLQSQEYVKIVLKSPSTADFPFADYTAVLKYFGGEDADPSNWQLEKLIFDGKIIYEK